MAKHRRHAAVHPLARHYVRLIVELVIASLVGVGILMIAVGMADFPGPLGLGLVIWGWYRRENRKSRPALEAQTAATPVQQIRTGEP